MVVLVHVDEQRIKEIQQQLGKIKGRTPNAVSRAMNRAITATATSLNKEIRKDYHIKAGDVSGAMKREPATVRDLNAAVRVKGSPIGLDKFKVSPKTVNPNRKSQLNIAVKKDGMKRIQGAFNLDLHGVKVFERTGKFHKATKGRYKGKKREKIERKFSLSVPQMAKNNEISTTAQERGETVFEQQLRHEIKRLIGRGG